MMLMYAFVIFLRKIRRYIGILTLLLYDFDFFEYLNTEIRKYSDQGDIFLLGDLNSRTSTLPDYITDLNLDRYVGLPRVRNVWGQFTSACKNHDNGFNNYGSKLLSLCKENNLCILNGRKEDGKCTYNAMHRDRPVSSFFDYVISRLRML